MKIRFAPHATVHLGIATLITVLLATLLLAATSSAIGPVNIPGPLHPDPLAAAPQGDGTPTAYAICGGLLDDHVARTLIITADEGEGRTFTRDIRKGCRKGWDVLIVTPEFWGKWMYGPYKPTPK